MLEALMGWVFFQVFLAFGVGVLIVWWTWPKTPKASPSQSDPPNKTAESSSGANDDIAS